MDTQSLALHEALEVHEILNFKTICMTKSKLMEGLVTDKDLKALLGKDVQQSIDAISNLQSLLSKAPTSK